MLVSFNIIGKIINPKSKYYGKIIVCMCIILSFALVALEEYQCALDCICLFRRYISGN